MPVTMALERWRQDDQKFQDSLSHMIQASLGYMRPQKEREGERKTEIKGG